MIPAKNISKARAMAAHAVISGTKLDDQDLAIMSRNGKMVSRGKMAVILDNRSGDPENKNTENKVFLIGGAFHNVEKEDFYTPPTKVKIAGGAFGLDLISAGFHILVKGFKYHVLNEDQFDQDFKFLTMDVFGNGAGNGADLSSEITNGKTPYHTKDNIMEVKQFEFALTPFKGMAITVLPEEKVTLILDVTLVEK